VRATLGRPTGEPFQPMESDREAVEAALRGLPSHGWTQGMFGRRDRCLLVLSQLAGGAVPTPRPAHRRRHLYRGRRRCHDPVAGGGVDRRSGRRRAGVRALRGHPVAEDPRPGRDTPEHPDHRRCPEEDEPGRPPLTARLPHRAGARCGDDGRAAAATDRPMGRPPTSPSSVVAAFALPPSSGPPGRGPRAHRDLPVDPDPEPTSPRRRSRRSSPRRPAALTTRWTRARLGTAAAVTLTTWPGSSTCSPMSSDARRS